MRVGRVALVGAGPGDPGLLTIRGRKLLRRADVVVHDRLVDRRLLDLVPAATLRIFAGKARGVHALSQEDINALLVVHARRGRRVVRLKGGDPFVFGRGGEEAVALAAAGIPFEVVPGVSAAIAVPAYAGIPLTYRGIASSFAVVTGHEDTGKSAPAVDWARLVRSTLFTSNKKGRRFPALGKGTLAFAESPPLGSRARGYSRDVPVEDHGELRDGDERKRGPGATLMSR